MDTKPDPDLSPDQQTRVALLSASDLAAIDSKLLENCSAKRAKVAKVVGMTMKQYPSVTGDVPDLFLASRLYKFVDEGLIEYQGFIGHMRYCEVRTVTVD